MQRSRNQALVITLGSPLAGEDAVGQCVHDALKDTPDARVVYLGTDIFRFSHAYQGEPLVIIVDAVYSKKHAAGEIVHFSNEEIFSELTDVATDAHMLGVGEGLKVLHTVMPHFPTELHFIGVSCKQFGLGEMSDTVQTGIEKAVALVYDLLNGPQR